MNAHTEVYTSTDTEIQSFQLLWMPDELFPRSFKFVYIDLTFKNNFKATEANKNKTES